MKTYIRPEISEAELFTQDSIALSIPKTVYKKSAGGAFTQDQLINMALSNGESLSGSAVQRADS